MKKMTFEEEEQLYLSKVNKRKVENRFTVLKPGGHLYIGLWGAAVEPHMVNTHSKFEKAIVVELRTHIYWGMRRHPFNKGFEKFVFYEHQDIFDILKKPELERIGEVDFDFCGVTDSYIRQMRKFITTDFLPNKFENTFSIIFTFTSRNRVNNTQKHFVEIETMLNNTPWCNIKDIYYLSYRDGQPMRTELIILEKSSEKILHSLERKDPYDIL